MCCYIVFPYMRTQYSTSPYMVLCNIYKQNVVDLESFTLENVIIYKEISIEKFAEKIRSGYNYIIWNYGYYISG